MRQSKPARLDKVLAWRQTYQEVLEELLHGLVLPDDATPTERLRVSAIIGDLRAAAARTAAILIQGVELNGDSDRSDR